MLPSEGAAWLLLSHVAFVKRKQSTSTVYVLPSQQQLVRLAVGKHWREFLPAQDPILPLWQHSSCLRQAILPIGTSAELIGCFSAHSDLTSHSTNVFRSDP
jgi:hypothetical protein